MIMSCYDKLLFFLQYQYYGTPKGDNIKYKYFHHKKLFRKVVLEIFPYTRGW